MGQKSLKILCFGDSLTAGYIAPIFGDPSTEDYDVPEDHHPYALKLKERLTKAFPDVDFDVVTNAVAGEAASFDEFPSRLKLAFKKQSFDWAIILGGTNDIAYGFRKDEIFPALLGLYDIAINGGSKVLALTVPETAEKLEKSTQARDELNKSILELSAPNFHVFDLRSHIPYHSLSEEDRKKYWHDFMHLGSEGYDWMGNHIADALIEILQREGDFGPTSSSAGDP
ncbi:hypothetical protein ACJ41O_002595 [Fusarium nematophilum]